MRFAKRLVAVLLLVAGLALAGPAAAGPTCQGRFMNPITDICWSCVFPLTIGSASLLSDGQNDIDNPSTPICYCNNPPRVGVTIGFWEPVRLVDVTRTPFCMVALGGIAIDPGIEVPRGAQVGHDSQTRNSFYHVHWYTNPILYWLEVLLDFPCLEQGALDLVYLTEVDPLWADDELTAILNPEAVLFANAPAKAACAADCVASSAGLGIASLFWCAGCQGSIYPMSGHVAAHIGGVQASALLTQRMTAKMHRQLATYDGAGAAGPVRLLHAADHGQDPLQAANGLPGPQHPEGCRSVLPALRTHDDDLGRRQVIPGDGRGLFVSDFSQKELLCRRVLIASPFGRWPASCPALRWHKPRNGRARRISTAH
jgi:conjugal transfer pilus assembly protein TraU